MIILTNMRSWLLVCLAAFVFLFSSCVVTQSLVLDSPTDITSGVGTSHLNASDFLVSVLEDLSCWNEEDDTNAFMEVAISSLARSIASSDANSFVYINKNENDYYVTFDFSNFNSLVQDMQDNNESNIIMLKNNGDITSLSFFLSMDNYNQLTNLIPLLSDPNFEAYGPVYNNPPYDNRSEEDYMYMMEFIFGEDARVIESSTVTILVDTPKPLLSTTGKIISDSSTAFEFRLIDFLLLHEPITFSCSF